MSTEIGRRQFLIASSACALATATIGPTLFAGTAGQAVPRRLAVGFAPMDEQTNVFAAASIPAGDGGFISRGARISVSGASDVAGGPLARRTVEVVAHYSILDGSERRVAAFRAWGCSRMTGCQGSPTSFTMPVDEMQALVFTVETERGNPQAASSRREALTGAVTETAALPVRLALSGNDSLKLVRGFYVIVPLFDDDRDPQWSRYALNNANGRWTLHDRDGNPAPFEHFVLRIDYGKL